MAPAAVAAADLRAVLDGFLRADRFAGSDDPHGVWLPGDRPLRAVGFALDPWPGIAGWVAAERLDALVCHRPWDVPAADLPGVAVFGYHLAFDEALTVGFNPWLAAAVGIRGIEPLGRKQGRPLGMIGDIPPAPAAAVADRFAAEFGAPASLVGNPDGLVDRVAVVGAMWPESIRDAAERGAALYVTGTYRPRAQPAMDATGIAVLVVGHDPPERWGMRTLAALVGERLPALRVVLAPGLR